MWVCLNDGFISVVEDLNDENRLLVRSRRIEILEKLFPGEIIVTSAGTDYKYRTFVDRKKVAEIIKNQLLDINYGNFKNSVVDHDLHDLYNGFWSMHYRYQL